MNNIEGLKRRVIVAVDARRDDLFRIASRIHAHPELSFQEFEAMALLTEALEKDGFELERAVAGLETAFIATLHGRDGGPTVAFLAEYDALWCRPSTPTSPSRPKRSWGTRPSFAKQPPRRRGMQG